MVDRRCSNDDVKRGVKSFHLNKSMSRNALSDKKKIASVLRYGRRWRGSFFTLIAQKSTKNRGEYAVSISKKALAHATDRNLVRRRAQNALRRAFLTQELHEDCVVQLNTNKVRSFQEIDRDLRGLLSNIKQN